MSLETWRYGICWGEDPTRRGVVLQKTGHCWIQVRFPADEMKCRTNQVIPLSPDNALTTEERAELAKEIELWRDVQDLVDSQVVVAACDGTSVPNVYVDKDGVTRRQFEIYALPGGGVGARNCVTGIENVLSDSQAHFPKAKIVHALKIYCGYYTLKTTLADEHLVRLSALVGKKLRQGMPGGSSTKAPVKKKAPAKKEAPAKKKKVSYAAPAPVDCQMACRFEDAQKLKEFLDGGWEDSHDLNRALCQAAWLGRCDMIRMLLDHGAKVDANAGGDRQSPLFFAASEGRLDAAKMLIDAGADACFTDDDGFSPLMVAAKLQHTEVARLLISKGADVEGSSTVAAIRAAMEAEPAPAPAAAAPEPTAMETEPVVDKAVSEQS